MKRLIFSLFCCLLAAGAMAQGKGNGNGNGSTANVYKESDYIRDGDAIYVMLEGDKVFLKTEVMPVFSKGDVRQWIARNVTYPVDAMERGVTGKVYVQFIVEKDGSVTDIKTLPQADASLRREVERLCGRMPGWKAGKHKGKTVRVQISLPVSFSFSSDGISAPVEKRRPDVYEWNGNYEVQPEFLQGDVKEWIKERVERLFRGKTKWKEEDCGEVFVMFTIGTNGAVSEVGLAKGIGGRADREAVRIVEAMPKWKPAMKDGKPVKIRYTLPVDVRP